MKFIERFKTLAEKEDNNGMRELLQELANDGDTFSTVFKGFGSCSESQTLCFYYSEGEVGFLLVDTEGIDNELADEQIFDNDVPRWFSETDSRVSPFAQVTSLTIGFLTAVDALGQAFDDVCIDNYLSILVSNTHIINYDDMVDTFASSKGAVFHNVTDINLDIPYSTNNIKGKTLLNDFKATYFLSENLQSLFERYKFYFNRLSNKSKQPEIASAPPFKASEYFEEKDLDEFFALEDPDFKTTEEAVNLTTGEKVTLKKDTDLPPVTILEPIVDPEELLNEMVGLSEFKTTIAEMVAYAKYSARVKECFPDYSSPRVNLHTIITGNSGTGKTTMCRIYGGLLHKAGVLSNGHTVVATRSSFIGLQFGTEELRMRQCLKLAQGGCLFIDEAGQLFSNSHPHDPGRGVIQLMLQLLAEEENRDIVVVLALYANDKSLERLYDLNPGIKSRFANVLSFPDYTWDELIEIAHKKIKSQGLSFTPKAWQNFCKALRSIYDNKDKNYGNAREVVNLLQRCVIRHAVRCDRQNVIGRNLLRITAHDIPEPQSVILHNRMGFK